MGDYSNSYSDDPVIAMTAKSTRWDEPNIPGPTTPYPRTLLQRLIIALASMAVLALVVAASGAYRLFIRPMGGIEIVDEQADTSIHRLEISGHTKDLSPGRSFVWIVADAPRLKMCWPIEQIQLLNGRFKTEIAIKSTDLPVWVSLYVLNGEEHDTIRRWLGQRERSAIKQGLPLLSERSRLDSTQIQRKR